MFQIAKSKVGAGIPEHIQNLNGRGLFCLSMVFGFPMVDKMVAFLFCFNGPDHWKTELFASLDHLFNVMLSQNM